MNGPQDLGGQHGFGPVAPEPNEPWFHAAWEERALAITLAAGACGMWTIDESRHARESLTPTIYLSSSYYEIWTRALQHLLERHGMVTGDEVERAASSTPPIPVRRVLRAGQVPLTLARGGPCNRPATSLARFAPGDRVRTRQINPEGHTRLPRYARDKGGMIEAVRGVFVYPDPNAHGAGEQPQWLYTVRFTARELWGEQAEAGDTVSIDAFEPYLHAPSSP